MESLLLVSWVLLVVAIVVMLTEAWLRWRCQSARRKSLRFKLDQRLNLMSMYDKITSLTENGNQLLISNGGLSVTRISKGWHTMALGTNAVSKHTSDCLEESIDSAYSAMRDFEGLDRGGDFVPGDINDSAMDDGE